MLRKIHHVFLALLIFSGIARSQSLATAPQLTEDERKAQQELEKKALKLLDDVVGEAQGLRLPENRVRAMAVAADLLWKHDEKRARALYQQAAAGLGDLAVTADQTGGPRHQNARWVMVQLRREVLQSAARHDAKLALDLLQASRFSFAPSQSVALTDSRQPDEELRLEQSLAAQVAAHDPKQALKMAEASLAKGLSYEIVDLFLRIQQKDREAGAKLFGDIVRKLQTETLTNNGESSNVAHTLLRAGLSAPRRLAPSTLGPAPSAATSVATGLDQQSLRDLVELVATAALAGHPNNPHLLALQAVWPEIEKLAPARVALLRRKLAETARAGGDARAGGFEQYQPLIQNGTAENLIEAAAKAPPDIREALYMQAAWKSMGQGDTARARQIISDNVRDAPRRTEMLAQVERQSIWRAASQGDLDQVQQAMARNIPDEERAMLLTQLATVAAGKKDRKLAAQLFQAAEGLINERAKNHAQLNMQLQFALAYAGIDPARSFDIIDRIIDQGNELIAAAAVLDGFGGPPGLFREGEMVFQTGGASPINPIFNQHGGGIGTLGRADFERANRTADRFQRPEARVMFRLMVAQSILSEQQPMMMDSSIRRGREYR